MDGPATGFPAQAVGDGERAATLLQAFGRRFARNRLAVFGVLLLVVFVAVSLAAPLLAPMDPHYIVLKDRLKGPLSINSETGQTYWLGTDVYGRDLLSRMLYGGRISLRIGFISMSIAVCLGIIVGSLAGFYGRLVDNTLMRFTDIILSMPTLPLLIVIIAFVGNSIEIMMVVIGLTSWPAVARSEERV